MPTDSSSSSITTSSSTSRTNPLTKLFSKNKSASSLLLLNPTKEGDDNSSTENSNSSTLISDSKKTTNNPKFRISRSRLKFSKNSSKPDLTIQTTGHHNIRVPKNILSSTSLNESGSIGARRNSINSPISSFHSFFHRSHAASSPLELSNSKAKIEDHSSNSRTALCLSSNSSNSYITDIKLAMIYKFTDPNYSIDDVEGNTDYNSFHKRMLLPVDSYFQSKVHKNSQDGNMLASDSSDNGSLHIVSDFSQRNATFFVSLMNIIKPLFMIPIHKNTQPIVHSSLGYSIEDISAFVKENLFEGEPKTIIDASTNSPNKQLPKSKNKSELNDLSFALPNDSSEDLDYFKVREVLQDVRTLFNKCLNLLKREIRNMSFNDPKSKLTPSVKGIVTDLMVSWQEISLCWTHFNKKIRFYILTMFEPLQGCFDNVSQQKYNLSLEFPTVNFEKELLLAFRDVILIPFLLERKQKYFDFTGEDTVSDPDSSFHTLFLDEQTLLQENSQMLCPLIDCLGTIQCKMLSLNESPGDGEPFYEAEMIPKTFTWLSSLS
ncbi:hypothetical protein JA1_004930 [Spathaspora sp. JA1]|nr:hypothetical protein JA1_004930 [Spathaspora sp. JA1]